MDDLFERLKEEEGFSPRPFWDRKQWTWGYGTPAPGGNDPAYYQTHIREEISRIQAENLLRDKLRQVQREFSEIFHGYEGKINHVRKNALIDMLFNLGMTSFLHFRKMMSELGRNEICWPAVAFHAWDSTWRKQVGKRAERIVSELGNGNDISDYK